MKQFIAGKNEQDVRLSRFVQNVTHNMPNSLLFKSFRNKRIKVNGKKADADYRINEGDLIELYINDEFFIDSTNMANKKEAKTKKFPPLNILYEDNNILAIFKPFHMLCHSDKTGDISLVDIICNYLQNKGDYDKESEHTFTPAVCNRLDRGTEGIVLAAKNYAALRDLNFIIKNNLIKKHYKCITVGTPKTGLQKAYLKHFEKNNKVNVQAYEAQGYKEILTGIKILERKGAFCLCDIDLITGRTHQIRAHLSFLKAPILGDIKYGNRSANKQLNTKTQALSACSIEFHDSIPIENSLNYLNTKKITLKNNFPERYFNNI